MGVEFPERLVRDLGRCIGCGACNIPCPMFHVEDLRETEGPRARVKLLYMLSQGKMELTEEFLSYIFTCMNCGLCSDFCPVGIDVFDAIVGSRSALIDMGYVPLVTVDMRDVRRRTGSPIGDKVTKGVWLPPDYQPQKGAELLFFGGCWMHAVPEVALATNRLLKRITRKVVPAGTGEPCCGGLVHVIGERDSSEESREELKKFLSELSPKSVVSGCSLCANMFKDLGMKDVASVIEQALKDGKIRTKSIKGKKNRIFLVPTCRGDGASRRVLNEIENARVLEVPEWVCCDCGATLIHQAEPEKFDDWLSKLVDAASDADADYIVIEEVACYSMIYEALEGRNKVRGMKIISLPSFLLDYISSSS